MWKPFVEALLTYSVSDYRTFPARRPGAGGG
jgi:hypothetical protein